ncbi:oligosaccharide flippase family protein [candidate division KSB1 bacterium]|nr:oligosaccharide flippase family protein [candidate division KSB1 bacterium]
MIQSFHHDALKYLPSRILPALVSVLTIPVFTRLFAPGEYGMYVLVMTTVFVLGAIVDWLGMAIIRFYPASEREGTVPQLFRGVITALICTMAPLLFICLAALSLLHGQLEPTLHGLMLIGVLLFAVGAASEVAFNFLRSRREIGWYSVFALWKSIAGVLLGVLLAMVFDLGITGLLWGHVVASLTILPFVWKLALKIPPLRGTGGVFLDLSKNAETPPRPPQGGMRGRTRFFRCINLFSFSTIRSSLPLAVSMARYSMPLVAGNIALWVLSLSDRYIIEYFQGSHAVGVYSVSYSLTEKTILFLTALFRTAAAPLEMTTWEKEGGQKSRALVESVTRSYLLLAVPLVVLLCVFAQPIVAMLTTAPYHEGYRLVPFVAAAVFLSGLEERFESGLLYQKKTNIIMWLVTAAGLANIALNLFFVPRYGFMAAALTTLACYAALFLTIMLISLKHFTWKFPLGTLARSGGAALLAAVIILSVFSFSNSFSAFDLFLSLALAVTLYGAGVLLLGEISVAEIRGLLSLKR